MRTGKELEKQWLEYCDNNPSFLKTYTKKITPFLIGNDSSLIRQGLEFLLSNGDFSLMYLFEYNHQISIKKPFPGLSNSTKKDLKTKLK